MAVRGCVSHRRGCGRAAPAGLRAHRRGGPERDEDPCRSHGHEPIRAEPTLAGQGAKMIVNGYELIRAEPALALAPDPRRGMYVKRGLIRLWFLFSTVWCLCFLGLFAADWYHAASFWYQSRG